jgi:light-regulated signal transduction histidine kinase (bacteriophytochrome)
MQSLIRDLLELCSLQTQAKPLEQTDCNIVLQNVLANLQFTIREAEAVVHFDTLPKLSADSTQLTQLLQNLIGNAIKFRASRPIRIAVKAKRRDAEWLFSVSDNGIGIEPQFLERIFGIFQRLHSAHELPGTGIGLAICKKIVERHGGRIWIESKFGEGSTVFFTIPDKR